MGVRGTVRNADDGSVEVRFAGGEEASARFREVLEIGPGAARVERVESIPVDGDLPERGIEVTW